MTVTYSKSLCGGIKIVDVSQSCTRHLGITSLPQTRGIRQSPVVAVDLFFESTILSKFFNNY